MKNKMRILHSTQNLLNGLKEKISKLDIWIKWILGIILILFLCIWGYYEYENSWDRSIGALGSWLSPWVALITTVLLIYISQLFRKRDHQESKIQQRKNILGQLKKYESQLIIFDTKIAARLNINNQIATQLKEDNNYKDIYRREALDYSKKIKEAEDAYRYLTLEVLAEVHSGVVEIRSGIENLKLNASAFDYEFISDKYYAVVNSLVKLEKDIRKSLTSKTIGNMNLFNDIEGTYVAFLTELEQNI